MRDGQNSDVVVVGGGLVGALVTCVLAKKGHHVRLYEYRSDMRVEVSRGVSIDLALSARGREALRQIDLEDAVVNHHGIAMKGRLLHSKDKGLKEILYDSVHKNCIYSVNRSHLNRLLLDAAEKYPNVNLFFNHKLMDIDLEEGHLQFVDVKSGETINTNAEFIIGADGAYSYIRRTMAKRPRFNCNQTYIDHGYVEVSFPVGPDNSFIMSKDHLHIWPRGEFMMIALPNEDGTFTGNVFAPFATFEALDTPEKLISFYKDQFPDALDLIGEKKLVSEFFQTSPKTLISIKCNPYNVGSRTLIIGDAAHAMVPFYAQGMNAGFEDVLVLSELLDFHNNSLSKAILNFTKVRCDDAHAICDLAMYNYLEMRDLVTKKSFLIRKHLDTILHWLFPNEWIPLYSTVTFSRMKYRDCIYNKDWQDRVLKKILICVGVTIFAYIITFMIATRN
ncbi:hypothetical protein TKK_0004220 [Trichogramma kaykai]|uniref:Kynurenine 3-monooxygenase n=1 Tax=Trichogramma kaykai TaxID=54128 RepID=A0ABD2XKY8_9HYME